MENFNEKFVGGKQATMDDGFIKNLSTLQLTDYEVRQIKRIYLKHKNTTYGELNLRIFVNGKMVEDEPIHWDTINENLTRILIEKYSI